MTLHFLQKLKPITLLEKVNFTRNLSVMLSSGLPLNKAMGVLSKQTNNLRFKKTILDIQENLQQGQTLADSLSLHPRAFSDFYINMIKVGEEGGTLEEVLKELAKQMKKTHSLKRKIKGALIYPAVIICAMFMIGIVMMIFVVPKLLTVFEQFNATLPLTTRAIIKSSNIIADNGLIFLGIISFLILFLILAIKKGIGKTYWHKTLLKLPIFGKIAKNYNSGLLARNLSSLLNSGIPIVRALKTTARTLKNSLYLNSLLEIAEEVQKGSNLSMLMDNYPNLYTAMSQQMVKVGEESGELAEMLENLAGFYEQEIDQTTKNLSSIIEPILILIIGAAVGFFAISMLQPMYSILQSV